MADITFRIAATVRAATPMTSVVTTNQPARSPVVDDRQIWSAAQDALPLLSSGFAPGTRATTPYAR
jgi:hypothetical protein